MKRDRGEKSHRVHVPSKRIFSIQHITYLFSALWQNKFIDARQQINFHPCNLFCLFENEKFSIILTNFSCTQNWLFLWLNGCLVTIPVRDVKQPNQRCWRLKFISLRMLPVWFHTNFIFLYISNIILISILWIN